MGAAEFFTVAKGANAQEAFNNAVEQAQYDHGHSGYTGTIAEKGEFKMVSCPHGKNPSIHADDLMEDEDHFCNDKWGPAACIELGNGEYLFFGWASS
jgi:hypothetical protein